MKKEVKLSSNFLRWKISSIFVVKDLKILRLPPNLGLGLLSIDVVGEERYDIVSDFNKISCMDIAKK